MEKKKLALVGAVLFAVTWLAFKFPAGHKTDSPDIPRTPETGQPVPSAQASPVDIVELKPGSAEIFSDHSAGKAAFNLPVAIAEVAPGKFVVANYQDVFLFHSDSNEISITTVNMNGFVGKFVPTNFAFVPGTNRLFIANYLGNDILETTFDLARNEITVLGRIRDEKTISPEGVAFDGRLLATANYDGNNVQVFEKMDGSWKSICDIPVPWAHGVAFVNGNLFATGLKERKLHRIDPTGCKIVGSTGSIGWEPGKFLWPTSVAPFGNDAVLVADAHTGLLTVIGADDFSVKHAFGGNGPGRTGFNMPYSAIASGGSLWVTSTYGGRLFKIDIATGRANSWDVSADRQWKSVFPRSSFLNSHSYEDYVRQGMDMTLGGKCYRASYSGVLACSDYGDKTSFPSYFVQIAKVRNGYVAISPQHDLAHYFSTSIDSPQSITIGFDNWLVDGTIVSPSGQIDVETLERKFGD